MSAWAVRVVVVLVCAGGVVGMIVASALNHNGAALTFGLVTAAAILCLMVATAVTASPSSRYSEDQAADVETRITVLVGAGADENAVRDLVRAAVRLGRDRASPP